MTGTIHMRNTEGYLYRPVRLSEFSESVVRLETIEEMKGKR